MRCGLGYEEGSAALRNGELLVAAEAAGFEVFLTADKNLRCQQNLAGRKLAIIELPTNRLKVLPFLVPSLQQALANAAPGSYQQLALP